MLPTSTAVDQGSKGYAFEAGLRAVQDALVRRGINGHATHGAANGLYDVYYDIKSDKLVSIIIPTKNGYKDVQRCVSSIIEKTTYQNYEIIMADNGSTDPKCTNCMQNLNNNYLAAFSLNQSIFHSISQLLTIVQ
ncbi:hypothetical protein EfsSVR2281_29330 [Enterococcus faecalis]|nr:hypothetical protein EfsSVR2281_29330 [Enterococcus faecalis]